MKQFEFDVAEKDMSDYLLKDIMELKNTNGLYQLLKYGYSYHQPILIRPDDVVNNIASVWSKYLVLHAEKFREFFVDHEGQKKLIYYSSGNYHRERMPEFMNGLEQLIKEDQKVDQLSWMDFNSSVSTDIDKLIRTTAKLASQKEYYEYGCTLCCGFPRVTLAGTDEDWHKVKEYVETILELDEGVVTWKNQLRDVVNGMLEGTEDFWQSCMTKHPYGSGSQAKIDGWVTVFNPINDKGSWISIVDDKDVLTLDSEFDIKVDDNGNKFTAQVNAGPTALYIKLDLNDARMYDLVVLNTWKVEEKE